MTGPFQRSPAIFALSLLAAVLLAALALEFVLGGREAAEPSPRRAVPAEAKLLPPLPQVTPEQAYAETAARPLFVPTRRPAPEVATAAAAPAFQRGQFTLQGVIVAGGTRTAMLREKANGRVHRLEVGRDVNGVRVIQIDPAVVTIGMGTEQEVLPLSVQRPGAPSAAPGAVAAAPPGGPGPFPPPPQASAFPAPAVPGQPPGAPPRVPQGPQSLSAGSVPFPTGPQPSPANPAAPSGAAVPPGASTDTMPMTPEELLARRRARRAQQNQ